MKRILFCEICPFTYRLSMEKEILKRHMKDFLHKTRFAKERTEDSLPVLVYQHKSLIRRRLGNVNMQLQENKEKETWKLIVQILISILTALGTTLGVTSCM